jgi:hypothetical protein
VGTTDPTDDDLHGAPGAQQLAFADVEEVDAYTLAIGQSPDNGAQGSSGTTTLTNHATHVFGVYSDLKARATTTRALAYFNILRVINDPLDEVFECVF